MEIAIKIAKFLMIYTGSIIGGLFLMYPIIMWTTTQNDNLWFYRESDPEIMTYILGFAGLWIVISSCYFLHGFSKTKTI